MTGLVLFGVGSSLCVDYEETCRRLGLPIIAGIQNRPGETFLTDRHALRSLDSIEAALLSLPCLCPLFTPVNRRAASAEASVLGFAFAPALIDPTAAVAASTELGAGSYVNAGVVIGAAGRIGRQVVINRGAGLGHHARIDDFVSIGPGAAIAAHAEIAEGATIGVGAVLVPKIRIGAHAVVGAGAVVTKDVAAGALMLGNPARAIGPARPA